MCGIVGAVAQRNVAAILIEGLRRLEYRGYDSAGIAVLDYAGELLRKRTVGKVRELEAALMDAPFLGKAGIAHTRWATHGKPAEHNAHPHQSDDEIALVHNGIIENHQPLREKLIGLGYQFISETDTEVVVHLINHYLKANNDNFLAAVKLATQELEGAFALGVLSKEHPNQLIGVRRGCPLVVGIGIDEQFIASDQLALLSVVQEFIYLEDGDIVHLKQNSVNIFAEDGSLVQRKTHKTEMRAETVEKGPYRHFMLKEIFEQPSVIQNTLEGRISKDSVLESSFGTQASEIFDRLQGIHIVACGTSYHAGLIAKYWIEYLTEIPCSVEIASEYRYRKVVVPNDTLFISISQSGETADTLAALRISKTLNYVSTLAICNVPESSLVRESELVFMTRAGTEIGVASTKAFTTQLTALFMLTVVLAKRNHLTAEQEALLVQELIDLPAQIQSLLTLDATIKTLSEAFADKSHALFLGRGLQYPVALEGALKLKEISYIHAEAYPAGELKHGPLALVDNDMPVITVAPNDELLEKLKSNLQEVKARGGQLYVFADANANLIAEAGVHIIKIPTVSKYLAPIVYTIPLQLLAYHVAVLKGTDVDQPRNLAKSVTVE